MIPAMNKNAGIKIVMPRLAATALLLLWALGPALAGEPYLAPGHPDGVALLPPPPEAGSEEAAADLELSRFVAKTRSPLEVARAKRDEGLSFSLFAQVIGPEFDLSKLPRTEALLKKVRAEIGKIIDEPKFHWKRKRPYEIDPSLIVGRPENSPSYPSGHSTRGTVYAMLLAEMYPEKREGILGMGRELGWDRVILGKHYLTDVRAGRVLGQAIVRNLMASKSFQEDLEAAKAEIHDAGPVPEKSGK